MARVITDPNHAHYKPIAVIAAGLVAHARGEEVDEDAMTDAAGMIVAVNLLASGISADEIEQMFRDRDYQFRYKYDGTEDSIEVSVEFLD